jgi:hypothetical protein
MHTHSTPRGGAAAAAAVVISAAALLPAALTVPAARAQQPETTAPATAGAIKRAVTLAPVRPGGGSYAYWTVSKGGTAGGVSSLTPDQKTASVLLEPDTREIHVLDEANGTLAGVPGGRRRAAGRPDRHPQGGLHPGAAARGRGDSGRQTGAVCGRHPDRRGRQARPARADAREHRAGGVRQRADRPRHPRRRPTEAEPGA